MSKRSSLNARVRYALAVSVLVIAGMASVAPTAAAAEEPTARLGPGITYNAGNLTDSIYVSRARSREIAAQMDADSSASAWKDGLLAGMGCARATRNPYATVACGAVGTAPRAFTESAFKNAALRNQCVQFKWIVTAMDSPIDVPPIPRVRTNNGSYCEN